MQFMTVGASRVGKSRTSHSNYLNGFALKTEIVIKDDSPGTDERTLCIMDGWAIP